MLEPITTIYRGECITFNIAMEMWEWRYGTSKHFADVLAQINTLYEPAGRQARALRRNWAPGAEDYTEVTVVAPIPGTDSRFMWVEQGGERRRCRVSDLYTDTPKNRACFQMIRSCRSQLEMAAHRQQQAEEGLERFTWSERKDI